MNTKRLCISIRPQIYDRIVALAKEQQVSLSRCIEEKFENDFVYSAEEALREAKQAENDSENGLLPSFQTTEEALSFLDHGD